MKKLIIIGMFLSVIIQVSAQKDDKPSTMDKAINIACECGESIQKRIEKDKKIHFVSAEAAHACIQAALNEY